MFLYNTKVTDTHAAYLSKKIKEHIDSNSTEEELLYNTYNTLSRLYTNAYSPVMIRRYISGIPNLKDMNETIEECICDLDTINKEHMNIANNIKTQFNERQTEKGSMINRIKVMNNTIDDAMFLNDQLSSDKTIMFRDSFVNSDNIDFTRIEGLPAEVSTKEGVVRLNVTSVENLNSRTLLNKIDGQGEHGNVHMVDMHIDSSNQSSYKYSPTAGDNPEAIFDENPKTFFEYTLVGVPEADKETALYYDIEWAKAKKAEPLRMRMVLEIDSEEVINMIDITPFFNINQTPRLKVLSIRSSLNGIDYTNLFEGPVVINPNLNIKPDTYVAQNLYLQGASLKLAGSGVFIFKPTKAKFIDIVFEQDHPFDSKIGHTYYVTYPVGQDNNAQRVRQIDVPKNIQDGDFAKHTSSDGRTIIEKKIEVFDGWKYSIGIKDIGIYKFVHSSVSEVLSIKYTTGDPTKNTGKAIKKLYLETDEMIPEEFTSKVNVRNNFIEYFVSFDDHNWIAISPDHRMPFGTEALPPKIIEINPVRASINSAVNASKYSHVSATPVYGFRLRTVLRRPIEGIDLIEFFSPILEEYRVKVELE